MTSKLLIISVIVLVYFRLFLPYPHIANDLHYLYSDGLESNMITPPSYRDFFVGDGLGQSTLITLSSWLIHPIFSLVNKLGLNFTYSMMLFGFLPVLILSYIGIRKLSKLYFDDSRYFVFGLLFYLTNSYFLMLIDGGQISIALAYSLFPLLLYYFKKVQININFSWLWKYISVFVVMSIFDLRYIYIFGIFVVFDAIYTIMLSKSINIKNLVIIGSVSLYWLIIFHLYWIIPLLMFGVANTNNFTSIANLSTLNFTTINHALYMQSPHWYKNIFGVVVPITPIFMLTPAIVLALSIMFKVNNLKYFLALLILGVFLTKGINYPLGQAYSYLFSYLPGFNLFRDSTKFFVIIGICYSMLIVGMFTKLNNFRLVLLLSITLIALSIMSTFPIWSSRSRGTFSKPKYQNEHTKIANYLENDDKFSRVLWIPKKSPLGYSSPSHPSLDGLSLLDKQVITRSVIGTYEKLNFVRDPVYMGELLNILGIGYVAEPFPDEAGISLKQDNVDYYNNFHQQLKNEDWISEEIVEPPVSLLKTKSNKDRIFLADRSFGVVGSVEVYNELLNKISISDSSIVFLEERPGEYQNVPTDLKIVTFKKNYLDVVLSQVDPQEYIFPAHVLNKDPNTEGWWKRDSQDLLDFRKFLQEKYNIDNNDFDFSGGWAVSEGDSVITIFDSRFHKGDKLFVRVLSSNRGGKVTVNNIDITTQDNYEPKELRRIGLESEGIEDQVYKYWDSNMMWYEAGTILNDGEATIKTVGEINVVNSLISIPENVFSSLFEKTKSKIIQIDDLESYYSGYVVDIVQESPTEYSFNVDNLDKISTLVFSMNYDPNWMLIGSGSNKKPFKVHGLVNGYEIDQSGKYKLIYLPQKYVNESIKISFVILISSGLVLLVYGRKIRNRI